MRRKAWRFADVASAQHRSHNQDKSEDRRFGGSAWPEKPHVDSHQECYGNGHGDGEKAPRAALEGIHDHQADNGDDNGDDGKHPDEGGKTGNATDLFLGHLADGFAVAPNRTKQDHKILHRAA